MNLTVTLFHGFGGWAVTLLAAGGLIYVLGGIRQWLSDRFELDLNPLTIGSAGRQHVGRGFFDWAVSLGIPRRLKIRRRALRPGASVSLADGRPGFVLYVIRDGDVAEPMAAVQPYDEDEQFLEPEWVPASRLRPLDYQEAS